jgi:integrase
MTPVLQQAVKRHFARYRFASYDGKRPEYVFHHPTTRRHYKAGDRILDMRRAFGNAARRAGLPEGFRRHDLRHRRVTTWLSEGKSPVLVQAAMGHASFKTTEDYLHLIKDHLRDLIRANGQEDGEAESGKVTGKVGG